MYYCGFFYGKYFHSLSEIICKNYDCNIALECFRQVCENVYTYYLKRFCYYN